MNASPGGAGGGCVSAGAGADPIPRCTCTRSSPCWYLQLPVHLRQLLEALGGPARLAPRHERDDERRARDEPEEVIARRQKGTLRRESDVSSALWTHESAAIAVTD